MVVFLAGLEKIFYSGTVSYTHLLDFDEQVKNDVEDFLFLPVREPISKDDVSDRLVEF